MSIRGLLVTPGSAAGALNISPGVAEGLVLPLGLTKIATVPWSAGNNGGMLDCAGPLLPSCGYHLHLIDDGLTTDILLSSSATNPLLPAGFTERARFACRETDADGVLRPMRQTGRYSAFTVPLTDVVLAPNAESQFRGPGIVPSGVKLALSLGCYAPASIAGWVLVRDPDLGQPPNANSPYSCGAFRPSGVAGIGFPIRVYTDAAGRFFTNDNAGGDAKISISVKGWSEPNYDGGVFDVALLGTSLSAMIFNRGWPAEMSAALQALTNKEIRYYDIARSGEASTWGVANVKYVSRLRPKVALIEFAFNDANTSLGISLAQSVTNTNTIIDAIQSYSPETQIFLMTMNPACFASLADRPNLANYYAQYTTIAAAQGVGLIDNYAGWPKDLPTLQVMIPDGSHPLLGPLQTYLLPNVVGTLGPLL